MFISGFRLKDFYIGVTNDSPTDVIPSALPPTYQVCKHYPGQVPDGATLGLTCDSRLTGRYLIIQLLNPGWNVVLTLCEVEVYGGWFTLIHYQAKFV